VSSEIIYPFIPLPIKKYVIENYIFSEHIGAREPPLEVSHRVPVGKPRS
jgi:hypothetical protein